MIQTFRGRSATRWKECNATKIVSNPSNLTTEENETNDDIKIAAEAASIIELLRVDASMDVIDIHTVQINKIFG